MDFSTVCRTCLSTDSLNPIFLNILDHERHFAAIFLTTGIKVKIDDGLPQKMCSTCINNVNRALQFRKKCKETDGVLQSFKGKTQNIDTTKNLYISLNHIAKESNNMISRQKNLNTSNANTENLPVKEETLIVKTESDVETYFSDEANAQGDDDDDKPLKYLVLNNSDNSIASDEAEDVYIKTGSRENNENNSKSSNIDSDFLKIKEVDENISLDPSDIDLPFEIDVSCDPEKKRVTCKLCRKSLSVRSIDSHMASKHPGKDCRKVKCDLCDKYILKEKINRHRMLMHSVTYNDSTCFRCGYCKTEFDDRDNLVAHITGCMAKKKKKRKINDTGREVVECDECHKTMQKASLRMHKEIKHAGMGPVCEHCGRRFGNKFRLNEHYRAKHGYDKFKCSYCEFQSAGVMAMRNHERRHRGEKPFVCDSCGAKFHAAYLLAQHKQSHRTERTIKCNLCPATFKANNSLHMHKITCHSKCLYKCHLCDRSYSCRHYVVKHLRHFHEYRGPVPKLDKVDREQAAPENVGYATNKVDRQQVEATGPSFSLTHRANVMSAGTTTDVDAVW